MNFSKFALILVASQIPAVGASALEHKLHDRDKDRMTAAHAGVSDVHYYDAQRPSKMEPVPVLDHIDPNSANGN